MARMKTPRDIITEFEHMESARFTWEYHWQELAEYMLPRKNEITVKRSPGEKRNVNLFDSTAMQSLHLLAGALHSLLTNPHEMWFDLIHPDKKVMDDDQARLWLEDSAQRIHNVLNNTNFQTEIHESYLDLSCFGTANLFIAEDPEKVVRFKSVAIDDYFVSENNMGFIDTVFRRIKWDAKQIIQEFGEKKVHNDVLKCLDRNDMKKFEIIHAVYPENISKKTANGVRFTSHYILKEKEHSLRIKSLSEFPYAVSRWTKAPGEVWGRSPGMNALPDAKTINLMAETMIKASQKMIDPPLSVPDDGFVFPIRTRPGAINIRRAGTQERVEPLFNAARLDIGNDELERRRQRIREAFYVDQLKLREGDRMTATEVEQRTEESIRFLGPILGRQENEFLRPTIDRIFNIMFRRGMFKEVPKILEESTVDVQYSSPVARAQRLNMARNIVRGLDTMIPFIQLDETAKDLINTDESMRKIAKLHGWPADMVRKKEEIEATREARAQAQQEQYEAEQQARQADIVSKVGNAAVNEGQ